MSKEYSYPLNLDWSTDELITVTQLLQLVEDAYEGGVKRQTVLDQYQKFKQVVPAKSEESQLGKEFATNSGYVLYDVIKAAKESSKNVIRLETTHG
ncbi:UPF0223 family protein [Paucilactobacillus sp. N302-9]